MTPREIRAVLLLTAVLSLRLLGIFMVLPIFSVYALHYRGATPFLAGLAFGIYPLVQSVFQMPFGMLSDRVGRKPVLALGLSLFLLGSLVAAASHTIWGLVAGRALQGMGAISAVAMATLGDLTRDEVRARAFLLAGIGVGGSFVLGSVAGPVLASLFDLSGVFWILAGLTLLALLVMILFLPEPRGLHSHAERNPSAGFRNLPWKTLRPIFLAVAVLAFLTNTFFFVYPLLWTDLGWDKAALWKVYLGVVAPMILIYPVIRRAEVHGRYTPVILTGWAGLVFAWGALLLPPRVMLLFLAGLLFFAGYTIFQPLLPAFLTRAVGPRERGTATGLYNLASFLASSAGGIFAGWMSGLHLRGVVGVNLALLLLWFLLGFPRPPEGPHAAV